MPTFRNGHILPFACMALLLLAAAASLTSCSTKKNNAATRNYQAFITRYNIYFNGDEHYKETIKEMEKSYEDDFTQLLFAHPADARRNPQAPQPSGDFTRSIEKAQKAIQLRSIKKRPPKKSGRNDPAYKEWLKREEYNPFLHNAWMMMGRSQYNNGDYLGAAATFYYIVKHFWWLPNTVTEAKIWQARSYMSMGWEYEAENILTKIPESALKSKHLASLYNLVSAAYWAQSKEPEKAIPYLQKAVKQSSGTQKSRLYFLMGQIYARTGQKAKAYEAFKKSATPSAPYRTRLNARIRRSEVYPGTDITKEVKSLRRMTHYDVNKDYLDQIYYAIGNLYLSRRDTTHAIDNYKLAIDKSTRNGIDKAICQLTLGAIYYDRRQYDLAQPCYSEAIPQLPESYPGYDSLKLRSDVLDELAVYQQNVTLNDSLLRLSELPRPELDKVIAKLIAELKKKEKEEADRLKREEYLASQQGNSAISQGSGANTPTTFMMNNSDEWYFYNQATRNAGKTEFQRRWGSRKLEDDWRRRNKSSFSFSDFESTNYDDDDDEDDSADSSKNSADGESTGSSPADSIASARESDPHYPEYYLSQIPFTDDEKQTANDVIQEGMYNVGLILKDRLDAYSLAADEWKRLIKRYPDNAYLLDIYYNMYLMYMRQGRRSEAEHYRQLILKEFPDSKYGQAMTDPDFLEKLRNMESEQERMYERAYQAYLNNSNDSVHAAYHEMMSKYPLSKIMPKFMFIDALTYVTENNTDRFREVLRELLERYPQTDVTTLASSWLEGLARGKQLNTASSNLRGMIWDMRLSSDSTAVSLDSLTFDLNPDEPQMLVLVYPTDEVSANELLYNVARHNFSSFVVKDFDLEQMNFGRLGLLLIKGFANFEELAHYRSVMLASDYLDLPPQVRPVMISVKNFDTLLHQGRTFEDYFRYVDSQAAESPVKAGPGDVETYDADTYGNAIMNDIPVEEDEGEQPDNEQSQ